MTTNVSPSRSNIMSSSHPSKGSLTDRPSSCSNKSLVHNKSCPVHSRHLSYKTLGQCHDKIEELEKQNARLVSKIKVLKFQLKTSSNLYNNIHQRPEKPLSRHSQRSTPVKLQKISRLSRVGFDENEKTIKLPERKFESTESFDSESSLVENKSKFKGNIELIQSHRVIKSMEIQMETLQAQCKAFEQNIMDINELLDKEREEHAILKEQLINEKHNLSELKPKYNAYKETNKALEEQIRDLQREKSSLREHNQKLLQLTSKPHHQNNGLKLKELEENFSDTRAGLLKQMEENSKYIAELKETIHENEVKLSNYEDENKCLKSQHLELSKILEIKENEITNRLKEIDNILQENDDLKKKLKTNITTSKVNESEVITIHQHSESEEKRLKSQIQELQQEQLKINQTLNSQSYLNTMLKDKVDQAERDIKTAVKFIKICMNLFKDITTLDLSEPLIATLEMIEKAVCSIKKSNEINVENKEFEELVNDILEVLVMFRDQMVKRRTILNQEQWAKKPIVNLITDNIAKSENTPRIQENSAQLEININSVNFSTESIQYLKSLQSEPNIFLTWGFKDQEDVAYSPSRLAWSADFNCSCFYHSNSSVELLHFVAKHGLFINVHLVMGKSSPVVAAGLVNTVDSINNPMVKFNLIVPITGQNIDAKLKCSIQLICDFQEIQTYSQMFVITAMVITADGQINRYINPAWLEMDANSEYYPGGEVISRILQAYGLGDSYGSSRLRSSVLDRNGYGRSYPRNRIINNLNNAYDSDPLLTQEYVDRNYDYVDNTIRGSNHRYRNSLIDIPRRTRINMVSAPRTTYYPADYVDRDPPSLSYSRSRSVIGDPSMSQELVVRGRETSRLIPRSTVATETNEKRKM